MGRKTKRILLIIIGVIGLAAVLGFIYIRVSLYLSSPNYALQQNLNQLDDSVDSAQEFLENISLLTEHHDYRHNDLGILAEKENVTVSQIEQAAPNLTPIEIEYGRGKIQHYSYSPYHFFAYVTNGGSLLDYQLIESNQLTYADETINALALTVSEEFNSGGYIYSEQRQETDTDSIPAEHLVFEDLVIEDISTPTQTTQRANNHTQEDILYLYTNAETTQADSLNNNEIKTAAFHFSDYFYQLKGYSLYYGSFDYRQYAVNLDEAEFEQLQADTKELNLSDLTTKFGPYYARRNGNQFIWIVDTGDEYAALSVHTEELLPPLFEENSPEKHRINNISLDVQTGLPFVLSIE